MPQPLENAFGGGGGGGGSSHRSHQSPVIAGKTHVVFFAIDMHLDDLAFKTVFSSIECNKVRELEILG